MRIKCIGCEVLARPLYLAAAYSPHSVDIELVGYGLHLRPAELRLRIQAAVDAAGEPYDVVALGYGLCGKSTDGLRAGRLPLVTPRAHDCITLFLGSRARYQQEFEANPGTYWYVQDYLERDDGSGAGLAIGANSGAGAEALYAQYVEKYGRDNADYLMEVMGAWQSQYNRAAYIDLGIGDGGQAKARAQKDAAQRGWRFEQVAGRLDLLHALLRGEWTDEDFLVLQPGETLEMSGDSAVIQRRG